MLDRFIMNGFILWNTKKTRITLSFKSRYQTPLIMLTKEYYVNNNLDFAKVLWMLKGKAMKHMIEGE